MKRQQDKLLIIIAMSGEMPTYLGQYVTGSISYAAALNISREFAGEVYKNKYPFVILKIGNYFVFSKNLLTGGCVAGIISTVYKSTIRPVSKALIIILYMVYLIIYYILGR